MGAWGIDPFGNDTACDWVYGLKAASDMSVIEESIQRVHDARDDYLDADIADEAIAAADVICRLCGHFYVQNEYTEDLDHWVQNHSHLKPSLDLIELAIRAMCRVKSEPSELLDLWMDSDESWLEEINGLILRLGTLKGDQERVRVSR